MEGSDAQLKKNDLFWILIGREREKSINDKTCIKTFWCSEREKGEEDQVPRLSNEGSP